MPSSQRRLVLTAVLAAFVALVVGGGCRGFFVNQPNSVTVTTGVNGTGSSTFTVAAPSTVNLFATASFNSGSKDVTNSATWASSSVCATVSKGVVTGVGATSSLTITATVAGVSGSATGTVTGTGSQLTITSPATPTAGSTGQFTATLNGADVTANSTWTSSDTTRLTFSTTTPGFATFVASGTVTVNASTTSSGSCASGSTSVTIQ